MESKETMSMEEKEHKEPIFVMTLEVEEGNTKQLKIFSDSNSGEVAFDFCKENNLDYETLTNLKGQIDILFEQYKKEEEKKMIKPIYNKSIKQKNISEHASIEVEKEKEKINEQNNIKPIYNNKNNLQIEILNNNNKKNSNNPLSKQIVEKHKHSSIKKNTKLFPYEFTIKDNRYKLRTINQRNDNRTISLSQSKNNLTTNQSMKSINNKSYAKTISNGVSISRITTMNSKSISKRSIFDRLFKDSEIKRVSYKRPCHFSSTPGKRNYPSSIMNNIEHVDDEYTNSYVLKSKRHNKFAFQPNVSTVSNNYRPIIASSSHSTINNTSNKSLLQRSIEQSIYRPLHERVIQTKSENAYLEHIRNEAFTNLFNDMKEGEGNELTKENLSLKHVKQNIMNDIYPILNNIAENNEKYTKERFITEIKIIFNTLSFDEKRSIVNSYKKIENNSNKSLSKYRNANNKSPYLFNSTLSDRNIRAKRKNKRNFYYVFS